MTLRPFCSNTVFIYEHSTTRNQSMKNSLSILLAIGVLNLAPSSSSAQNLPKAAQYKPNSGYVTDSKAAEDIGRSILSVTLAPSDELERTIIHNATLKDGVWTVQFSGPKTMPALPILIRIRQSSGAIIRYEDPAA